MNSSIFIAPDSLEFTLGFLLVRRNRYTPRLPAVPQMARHSCRNAAPFATPSIAITSAHKTADQWTSTVERMVSHGAQLNSRNNKP